MIFESIFINFYEHTVFGTMGFRSKVVGFVTVS